MPLPTDIELEAFRDQLNKLDLKKIESNVRHQIWGDKNTWMMKEAEAFIDEKKHLEDNVIKEATLAQIAKSNELQKQAKVLANFALGIAILAIVISIVSTFLK